MDRQVDLFYGSILHDIGKVVQRARNQRVRHSELGGNYLENFNDKESIIKQIRYHHAKEIKGAKLASNDLAYITYIADNLASGTDRRLDEAIEINGYINWDSLTNLKDIFNVFKREKGSRYYKPVMLDDREDIFFAEAEHQRFSAGDYAGILERINQGLQSIEFTSEYQSSVLNLLEATLSYVPSTTNQDETNDISLYDHLKLTATFASAVYQYLESKQITDYSSYLYENSQAFYQENAFLLISFDISGIQKFIYTIRDAKAAKMLRARSFYLELFSENLADNLLEALNLTRANLLYSGGGNAYLIAANTPETIAVLDTIEEETNAFLMDQFGEELYVAIGYGVFSGNMVMDKESEQGKIYHQASQAVSAKKLHRYTAEDIHKLNIQGKKGGRECPVCHRIEEDIVEVCSFCQGLIDFSYPLQHHNFFAVTNQQSPLPIGPGQYLEPILKSDITDEFKGKVYAKNKFYAGMNQSKHLWVGDYTDGKNFNDYADEASGINRLAVMRCDVDDLGQAFINGFPQPYNTFSRSATFSRNMSLFFKYHINQILKELDASATIIYAGGDDVFVIGDWQEIIQFAVRFREDFIHFTQGKLTLSTGIALFHSKTPVPIMARVAGQLEDAAKSHRDEKDSVSLFAEENTYQWDQYIHNIWQEKYQLIESFFDSSAVSGTYGKGFVYQLLELINQSFVEAGDKRGEYRTISWARWAYYLSKMEPSDLEKREVFRGFAKQLHDYFANTEEVQQLSLALQLYVYTTRGDE